MRGDDPSRRLGSHPNQPAMLAGEAASTEGASASHEHRSLLRCESSERRRRERGEGCEAARTQPSSNREAIRRTSDLRSKSRVRPRALRAAAARARRVRAFQSAEAEGRCSREITKTSRRRRRVPAPAAEGRARRLHPTKARLKAEPLPKPDGGRPMGGRCDEASASEASGEEAEE